MSARPGPWRITFDTNPDDCNLKCIMCEGFSPYSTVVRDRISARKSKRRMDIKLIRKILEDSRGTPLKEIIPSTMGEPLIYKYFEEIIELCYEFNVKLNLTTNGTFPRKPIEEWANLLVPITSDVKFSWNGATKETQEKIMLGTNWEKVVNNLDTFVKIRDKYVKNTGGNRCRVTLQLTFLETNIDELPKMVEFAIDHNVDRIKGHHLWAHFNEIKDLSMRRNTESIKKWNRCMKKVFQIAKTKKLSNGENIILENFTTLDESAQTDLDPDAICPFLNQEAWINTEGQFSPCCAPDELRKKLGDFGNVQNTTLTNIWEDQKYKHLVDSYKQHSLCVGCNMRKPMSKAS